MHFVKITMIQRILWISFILTTAGSMVGCGTFVRPSLPQSGPTMEQIYQQKLCADDAADGLDAARNQANAGWLGAADTRPYGYTRCAQNEIHNLFPKLPNPTIAMYVSPHLAGEDEAPVPGYTTAFTLYREDHFALPGEIIREG